MIVNCFQPVDELFSMVLKIPALIRDARTTLNRKTVATSTNPTTLWRMLKLLCRVLYAQRRLLEFTREQSVNRDAVVAMIYAGVCAV